MAKNVYHFYKSNTNKNEIIDFYAFSTKVDEGTLRQYILNDKDAAFSDMVQSLVQDIPYDKTTILKKDSSMIQFLSLILRLKITSIGL